MRFMLTLGCFAYNTGHTLCFTQAHSSHVLNIIYTHIYVRRYALTGVNSEVLEYVSLNYL